MPNSGFDPFQILDLSLRRHKPFEVLIYRAIRKLGDVDAAKEFGNIIDEEKSAENPILEGRVNRQRLTTQALEKRASLLKRFFAMAANKRARTQKRRAAAVAAFGLCCDPWPAQIVGANDFIMEITRDKSPEPPYPALTRLRRLRPVFHEFALMMKTLTFDPVKDSGSIVRTLQGILDDTCATGGQQAQGIVPRKDAFIFTHAPDFSWISCGRKRTFRSERLRAALQVIHDASRKGETPIQGNEYEKRIRKIVPSSNAPLDVILRPLRNYGLCGSKALVAPTSHGFYSLHERAHCASCKPHRNHRQIQNK